MYKVNVYTTLGDKKFEIHELVGLEDIADIRYYVKVIAGSPQGPIPLTFKMDVTSVKEAFEKAESTVKQGIIDLQTQVQPARIIT